MLRDHLLRPRPLREQVRDALRVDGPAWASASADAASVVALLSLLAGVRYGGVAVALFALVLLGVVVVRLVPLPGQLQALTVLTLVAAAWAALLEGYQRVPWLDVAAHTLVTGLLAVATAVLLSGTALGNLSGGGPRVSSRAGTVVATAAVGTTLAVLWELGEWVGHAYVDPDIYVSYDDTVGDLAAGLLGSLLAGALIARRTRRRVRVPR